MENILQHFIGLAVWFVYLFICLFVYVFLRLLVWFQVKRSKDKERERISSDSNSSSSVSSRNTRLSGRSRVHGSRSGMSEGVSNQITPVISVNNSTSATLRVSSMSMANSTTPVSSPRKGRKEDGWKEVGRRYVYMHTCTCHIHACDVHICSCYYFYCTFSEPRR